MKAALICLALLVGCLSAEKARFDNYRVYSLKVANVEQLEVLQQIEQFPDGYSFWESPFLHRHAEIVVPPHKFGEINEIFDKFRFENTLKVTNVQNLIEKEQERSVYSDAFEWTRYHTLDEIYAWLDEQLEKHPDILTDYDVGLSHENRTIRAIRLSHNSGSNPTIFVEAGIHAREWIAPATATFLLNQLLNCKNPDVRALAQNYDWVIIPVLNVDGYVYTHRVNRMWRKSRRPHNYFCYGADINRNFDFHWGESGSSSFPCSETFHGPHANSEVETVAISNFLQHFPNTKLYLSFHAYGQYLLFPYGFAKQLGHNHDDLNQIANNTVQALSRRFGTQYTFGNIAHTLYEASGSSIDWAYGTQNVSLAYVFELRGPPGGLGSGFLLPSDQIIPNGVEFVEGLTAMVKQAQALNYL